MDARQSLLDLFQSLNTGGTPLTTFQRILLITDGTVTDVIEAYANEPVRVVKLAQSFGSANSEKPELDLSGTQRVLRRSILLQGLQSRTNYLYADSVMVPDRLHPAVLEGLLESDRPLGRLLAERRIETFREIVGIGFEPAGPTAPHFGIEASDKLVFRTYRILVERQPVMRITEKFPVGSFVANNHR